MAKKSGKCKTSVKNTDTGKIKETAGIVKNDILPMQAVKTDPEGTWTGVPVNRYEKPVQDADDL